MSKNDLLWNDLTDQEIGDMLDTYWREEGTEPKGVKCECGCDKTFGKSNTAHSTWCPKYRKEK
jgi:hypothetical protein